MVFIIFPSQEGIFFLKIVQTIGQKLGTMQKPHSVQFPTAMHASPEFFIAFTKEYLSRAEQFPVASSVLCISTMKSDCTIVHSGTLNKVQGGHKCFKSNFI